MLKIVGRIQQLPPPFLPGFPRSSPQPRHFFQGLRSRSNLHHSARSRPYARLQARRPTIAWRPNPSQRLRNVRFNSTHKPPPEPSAPPQTTPQPPLSLSARLRELSRKYGWAAVGVYLGLSALDFPFCFLAVRWLRSERIGQAEEWVVDGFWRVVRVIMPNVAEREKVDVEAQVGEMEEAVKRRSGHEGTIIWTQLLLAYGVHKSLIVFRVPLTAAVTPTIVKWLRARGWKIGRATA